MTTYIDIDAVITMFKSTYLRSYLNGSEIARILEVRYGRKDEEESKIDAAYRKDSGLAPK